MSFNSICKFIRFFWGTESLAAFAHLGILPDSKVHGAKMGPTWVLSAPGGPHVGPMNLAIWAVTDMDWRKLYWV